MWKNKPTVVIGASPNADRYSFKATVSLQNHKHTVYPIGIKKGNINGLEIINTKPELLDIDTITLYIGPENQPQWYDYIIALKPKRLIFNPGTENPELIAIAQTNGIETEITCTLVLLFINNY
jgi:predicted CoA-binding protein